MKYIVSPQAAYEKWQLDNDTQIRGDLTYVDAICPTCKQRACYYSMAGHRELRMTGFCEPCFDFVCTAEEDRDDLDEWMTLVKYNEEA